MPSDGITSVRLILLTRWQRWLRGMDGKRRPYRDLVALTRAELGEPVAELGVDNLAVKREHSRACVATI